MADETTIEKTTQPVTEPKTEPKAEPPKTEPKTAAPKTEPAKGHEDDPSSSKDPAPDADGMFHLSSKNFTKRIARMAAKELRKVFGTSDIDKITAERREHEELKKEKAERDKKEDEARRAAMKEEERLKEDNAKLAKRTKELEAALEAKDEERIVDRQQHYLEGVAAKVVDGDSVDYALAKFKRHIRGISNREVEAMDEKAVAAWFADWAKANPKHAREAASEPKQEPKKVPLSTGGKPPAAKPGDKAGGPAGNKKPIDMTPGELKQYMRSTGRSMY